LLPALGVAGLGVYSFERLPIDAVPDITNVQVQINTAAYGLSAPEIEQRITYPIEAVMAGISGNLENTLVKLLWTMASYGRVQGRNRHLPGPPTDRRAVASDKRRTSGSSPTRSWSDRHRSWGNLSVAPSVSAESEAEPLQISSPSDIMCS